MSSIPFRSEQEVFWAGQFGEDYIERNESPTLLASNLSFFSKSLRSAGRISSCVEFGANIGMNFKALQLLYPGITLEGVEINPKAAQRLSELIGEDNVFCGSILDYEPTRLVDLSLIKGVLIHTNPDLLPQVYDKLFATTARFLLVAEYYNPSPVAVNYRGHVDRLFKRDFAGEIMERHASLRLLDYGFTYHRDPGFPQDDITWFLMEKMQ